jgi:hypothetical protein
MGGFVAFQLGTSQFELFVRGISGCFAGGPWDYSTGRASPSAKASRLIGVEFVASIMRSSLQSKLSLKSNGEKEEGRLASIRGVVELFVMRLNCAYRRSG